MWILVHIVFLIKELAKKTEGENANRFWNLQPKGYF